MSFDQLLTQLNFENRNRIKLDAVNLLASYRSLNAKIGTLIQNNGAALRVLDIDGTIPIVYGGTQYNIPIQMYLTEKYPQVPPQIYVRPTTNMVIKPNHKNVDGEGLVYLPYLFNWNFATSNLRELVSLMCGVFGQEPPLFSRQTVQATPVMSGAASYQPQHPPAAAIASASYLHPPSPSGSAYSQLPQPPAAMARPVSVSQYDKFLSPSTHSASPVGMPYGASASASPHLTGVSVPEHLKEQQGEREKERLLKEATSRLQEEILLIQTRIKGEIDEDLHTQFELGLSRERVEHARREIISLRERFQNAIELVKQKDGELDRWVEEKENELRSNLNGTADASVSDLSVLLTSYPQIESKWVPYDDLSAQLVRLQSDYLAMDDAMYYLDRALANNSNRSVDLNVFLRETRKLAREQFLCKAHIRKIQNQISLSYR